MTEKRPLAEGPTKTPTGIEGFDEITGGGLPRGRTTLVLGGPGTGKTVFALQMLVNGARQWHEPGIFVAFEERSPQLISNAVSFGWDLPSLEAERLFFLDVRVLGDTMQAGAFDLAGVLAALKIKAEQMGARRIVFDSVDVLLALLDDPLLERHELYRIHDWLAESGMTGIITARTVDDKTPHEHGYEFLPFMADCVVLLTRRMEDRISLRDLRVLKYRGSGFAENQFPMLIGPQGIEVASFGVTGATLDYPVSDEQVSSGIERLDAMLDGGYYRGSSVLITGAPGTAKSTLCGAFVEATCQRGERALYVSFDEGAQEIIRNLASVNIQLAPHVASSRLRIYATRARARSAEEHLMALRALIREHQPHALVVDPLSAITHSGGEANAQAVAQRLIHLTKAEGITAVLTSLLERANPYEEETALQVSTIADAWIHVSYAIQGGERNRALTVIKARGVAHSNQVRELVLSDDGLTLADVYMAGGEVLMGTLRWEKEAAARREQERIQAEYERKRRELELAEIEANLRIQALQRELELRRSELEMLQAAEAQQEQQRDEMRRQLGARRGADRPGLGR